MSGLDRLQKMLFKFKRTIRLWYLSTGLCYVFVSIGIVFFSSLFLDRVFRFDFSQRVICLVIGVIYIAFMFYRYVILPLMSKISEEYLCLAIEKRRPDLAQKITSGYQFATLDQPEVFGYSQALVDATIQECIASIDSINLKDFFDNKLKFKLFFCGLVSMAMISFFALNFTSDFSIWFHRNVLLENVKWPRKTVLKIEGLQNGNKIFVPEGDPYELVVHADVTGFIPDLIELKISNGRKESFAASNKTGVNEYIYRFEKVSAKFSIIVFGGDDESESIQFFTIQKPEIANVKFICTPPAYTGLPEQILDSNQSSWMILEGSSLKIEGSTNKSIVRSELLCNNNIVPQKENSVGDKKFSVLINNENLKSGSYQIKVFDEKGITKTPGLVFSINMLQDKLPEIGLKLDYNSDMITLKAQIPSNWNIKDDFGVSRVNLMINVLNKDESNNDLKKISLFDNNKKTIKDQNQKFKISLSEYPINVNQQILIYLEGYDFYVREPLAFARSSVVRLNVVSTEEFEKYVYDKEQELSVEIERLIKEEEALQVATASVLDVIKKNNDWAMNENKEMMLVEKRQKLMEQRNIRVNTRFDLLLNDMKVNQLDDDKSSNKIRIEDKIKNPLIEINEKMIPLAMQLSEESRTNEKLIMKTKSLNELIKTQGVIIGQYSQILKAMKKWEGYYETVGLLKEIIKEQKALKDKTENKTKENIKGVFDE